MEAGHPLQSRARTRLSALLCIVLTLSLWGLAPVGRAQAALPTPEAPSLSAQLRAAFPALAPQLAARASFAPATRDVAGQALAGLVPAADPLPPEGMLPAERAAWLAMARRSAPADGLSAFFPQRFSDPLIVSQGAAQVRLQALDAASVAGAVEDGALVYREAYPATDSVYLAGDGQVKELLYLRDAGAPTRFAYTLDAGADAQVTRDGAGGVRVATAGGTLTIAAPWLVDATGRRSTDAVRWELAPGRADGPARLTLALDPAGLAYPLLIDPTWGTITNTLASARTDHTATLLASGQVLVVGGSGSSGYLSSAELYDPATGNWSATGSLATARRRHTATLLASGQVLVVGGSDGSGYLSSAEVYDPTTGSWSDVGSLSTARQYHTATLLLDGTVLVVGGSDGSGYLSSAERYDPATGSWSPTDSLASARGIHTATLLASGQVLVVGAIECYTGFPAHPCCLRRLRTRIVP
ncbi:hypothetical protein K2Z83_10540 [Oscillochloris sp. ZM17-4]|uniref:Kelch repeat-containing protein n=1 Tax=Oscillochloris sp. ZM17-4 TaxID=2866714 RepID=UPI001C73AB9C|nr:kelch repeat-containing protein [Oscillochloris sp. ZM17-4]MBX0328115.1 hypothetical protein [Oscillochloris sp. ZM17-4]